MNTLLPAERVESKILLIRGQKVMLDRTLAELYGVEAKVLNRAVKRNRERHFNFWWARTCPLKVRNTYGLSIKMY
ncbi:MAG: ORF6N domain-containing protein [Deltaproteobacteria bacterium]|nr:ORF6N domain-containing protein [Deltaproteobacteria bacterium]